MNKHFLATAYFAVAAVIILSIGAAASAQTITVNTLDDVSDFSGLHQVGDLPGADGLVSFREAVTAANNTSGSQTIAFAIPASMFWLVPDVALLRLEQGPFFLNDSGTTIDFASQTANIGNTNSGGPEIGIYGLEPNGAGSPAIFINGNNCLIKGLGKVYQRGYAVRIVGNNNRVTGCQIDGPIHAAVYISGYLGGATPTGNIVGGMSAGEGNSLTGLTIDGPADGNIVIGNTLLIGVSVHGATQFGAGARNNRIGGPSRAERNLISGAGYFGEEGFPVGEQVSVVDADGTLIEGNLIGTSADGMRAYPQNGPVGVEVRDSRGTTIRGNVIAGLRVDGRNHAAGMIFGQAIDVNAVNANTSGTTIENNWIGLAVDRVTPIATRSGITVSPVTSSHHAFGTRIASNHIASVEASGILVGAQENGVTITGNSIQECGGLGIDLAGAANGSQNDPVIVSVVSSGSGVTVQGTLDSASSAQFAIELFSSPWCDPSGFGEGSTFLGTTTATTDATGHATFSVTLPATVPVGAIATATATRLSSGDTSEFSSCVSVTAAAPPVVKASATPTSGGAPLTVQFSSAGSSDPSSYAWSFGDGFNSSVANPTHIYAAGNYTARLTVTNSNNISASKTIAIVVNTVVRSASIELSVAMQGSDVSVTGQVVVRNSDGAPVPDAMVSAAWTKPGGETVAVQAATNASGIATFNTIGGFGTYTLSVSDATGTGYTFDAVNSVLAASITQGGRRRTVRRAG